MFQGYVKLHRKLLDNALWKSEPFTKGQAWVDLIMLANHKESLLNIRGIMVPIKRGQIGYSELKLAARWHWSRGKVRRFLKWLKTEHQIGQQKSNVTSLINLINYSIYQSNDTTDDTADGHQTDTKRYPNKNDKNVKNEKKERARTFSPPTQVEVLSYFKEKGYTEDAAKRAYEYYNIAGWKDSRGRAVKNWKQKMLAVWFKDENKDMKGKESWMITEEDL